MTPKQESIEGKLLHWIEMTEKIDELVMLVGIYSAFMSAVSLSHRVHNPDANPLTAAEVAALRSRGRSTQKTQA